MASLVSVTDPFGDSGSGTAEEARELHHCGCVAQPFPDVPLCLSTIWLLSPSDPTVGGTHLIPGSHRDTRNPRSTLDGIDGLSIIPNEIQVHLDLSISHCATETTVVHSCVRLRRTDSRRLPDPGHRPGWLAFHSRLQDLAQRRRIQSLAQPSRCPCGTLRPLVGDG